MFVRGLHHVGWLAGWFCWAAFAQSGPASAVSQYSAQGSPVASQPGSAVSYASVTQANGLLAQLEATSRTTQNDLAKLRIEKWKTDAATKKQSLADAESIRRNLQDAMPAMMDGLRNAAEDMPATFNLYRNLDALYDVLGGVAESAGAFGPKDDFQALSNDLNAFEGARKQLAERLSNLAASKEQEIGRLRSALKTAQAAVAAAPPKKVVVDDTEPPKKTAVKKKPVAKKPAAGGAAAQPAQAAPPPAKQR
jgi:hypothetical protein